MCPLQQEFPWVVAVCPLLQQGFPWAAAVCHHPQVAFPLAAAVYLRRVVVGVVFHLATVPVVVAVCHHRTCQIFP